MNIFELLGLQFNWVDLFIILGIFVFFFLLIREVLTWYWKLNKIARLLEKIEENTRKPSSQKEPRTDALGFKIPD
jgi:hypothetical protein